MAQFSEDARGDDVCVVRAAGDIDLAVIDEFMGVVRGCLRRSPTVEIDLGGVTFIDSSGLGALVRLRKEAEADEVTLRLTEVNDATNQLLQMTGLGDVFDISTRRG